MSATPGRSWTARRVPPPTTWTAPLLRRAPLEPRPRRGPGGDPACQPSVSSRRRSTAAPSATTCSARAGAPTSGGSVTARTTSPTCSGRDRRVLSATAGTAAARLERGPRLYGDRPASPSSRSPSPTATSSRRHRRHVAARPSRRPRRRPLRRPDDRRGAADGTDGADPPSGSMSQRRWSSTPTGSTRYVGPPVSAGGARARRGRGPRRRAHARRLRAEPRRLGAVHGHAATRAPRSRCGTPRCSRTASSASAAAQPPQATDRFILSGGDDVVRADPHLPRLPLRRDRRAGRAS